MFQILQADMADTNTPVHAEDREIVFVLGRFGRGGAERVVSRLARSYVEDGWRVTIATLLEGGDGYPIPDSVTLVDLSERGNRLPSALRWLVRLNALRRLMVKRKARAVVALMAPINVFTLLASWGLRCAVVVSERSDPLRDRRSRLVRLLTHRLYPTADLVVFQTEYARRLFPQVPQARTAILPNPVIITQSADDKRSPLIVSVGRMSQEKNQAMLVRAFARVIEKHPQYRLLILGEGPLRSETEALVRSLGLSDSVALPGESSSVHSDISDAIAFVLSSNYEGFSNALLEAMRMGIFCISTDCAGSRQLIEDGVNGRLVPRGDVESLTQALLDVIGDPALRLRVEGAGVKSAARYDAEVVMHDWKRELAKACDTATSKKAGFLRAKLDWIALWHG